VTLKIHKDEIGKGQLWIAMKGTYVTKVKLVVLVKLFFGEKDLQKKQKCLKLLIWTRTLLLYNPKDVISRLENKQKINFVIFFVSLIKCSLLSRVRRVYKRKLRQIHIFIFFSTLRIIHTRHDKLQALVVQKMDIATHRINRYPADKWGINIFTKFAKKFILYYIKKFVRKTLFCIFLLKIFFSFYYY